jgi:hypothetical protein
MRWRLKFDPKVRPYEQRWKRWFAFFPERTKCGVWVWLEAIWKVEWYLPGGFAAKPGWDFLEYRTKDCKIAHDVRYPCWEPGDRK